MEQVARMANNKNNKFGNICINFFSTSVCVCVCVLKLVKQLNISKNLILLQVFDAPSRATLYACFHLISYSLF